MSEGLNNFFFFDSVDVIIQERRIFLCIQSHILYICFRYFKNFMFITLKFRKQRI